MARTTIHLMRHGEVHNPEGVLYGRLPGYHLSDLGREMAAQVADVLSASGHDVVGVVTSPLERAVETGAPTAAAFALEADTDDRLTEAGNRFEGVPVNRNRWLLAHPRYWAYYLNPLRPSWGESYADLVVRVSAPCATPARASPGTRRSSCPTSCPSGRPACGWRAARSPTTPGAASAPWPR